MCGIVGILRFDGGGPDGEIVARMLGAIEHRGPDDNGAFYDGPLALGFRRLSIIDVACGHQPLTTADGRHTIIFNGEIYNYRDVRHTLEQDHGCRFLTNSDTEVIANAVATWGEAALPRLNGMFAFAVWDHANRKLLLARDRLGKKPLHFVRTPKALIFASEIKALLQHPDIHPQLNCELLPAFLAYRYVPGGETLLQGIEVLQPACVMTASPGSGIGTPQRWWDYEFAEPARLKSVMPGKLIPELRELLLDSVRLRMISEVPLGAFLSGGIDSSVIVALMAQAHPEPVKTFSIGFDTGFSETEHAQIVARHFKTDHHERIVTSEHLLRAIPAALYARESPISEPSDIPIYLLSQLARTKVTVVLSGEGSDEIFAGYPKYVFEKRFGPMLRNVPGAMLSASARMLPAKLRRAQLALECMSERNRLESYACWFGAFGSAARQRLFADPALAGAPQTHAFAELATMGRDFSSRVDEMMYLDTRHWLPANLLLRGDRMTMAHSLELRCPFLDYRLLQFAASQIPLEQKIRGNSGKWILKQLAEKLLPPEIIHRKKWGFKVPVAQWFRGALTGSLREVLLSQTALQRGYFREAELRWLVDEHIAGRANHEKQLWILYQLELWQRMFIDRTLSREDSLAELVQ